MDISGYVRNSEWDLISAEGRLNTVVYECCPEPYLDITYTIRIRRRPLPTSEMVSSSAFPSLGGLCLSYLLFQAIPVAL